TEWISARLGFTTLLRAAPLFCHGSEKFGAKLTYKRPGISLFLSPGFVSCCGWALTVNDPPLVGFLSIFFPDLISFARVGVCGWLKFLYHGLDRGCLLD